MPHPVPVQTFKYITVVPDPKNPFAGKPTYPIVNLKAKDVLGVIFWYSAWRQWVAKFNDTAVFSTDCLADIQTAIATLAAADKEKT